MMRRPRHRPPPLSRFKIVVEYKILAPNKLPPFEVQRIDLSFSFGAPLMKVGAVKKGGNLTETVGNALEAGVTQRPPALLSSLYFP
jgi:hypothetical protein